MSKERESCIEIERERWRYKWSKRERLRGREIDLKKGEG
jgi:hypothetical protein